MAQNHRLAGKLPHENDHSGTTGLCPNPGLSVYHSAMERTTTKPGQFPYIETLTKTGKVVGVKVTVTAKLVVRGGWQNA
jgi:hypothetical protein